MSDTGARGFDDVRFAEGARLYDEGAFYAAHEAWESLWRETRAEPFRSVLQGLIQVAAAFHKLTTRGDRESATRILSRALTRVALQGEPAATIDWPAFQTALHECRRALTNGASTDVARALIPKLRTAGAHRPGLT